MLFKKIISASLLIASVLIATLALSANTYAVTAGSGGTKGGTPDKPQGLDPDATVYRVNRMTLLMGSTYFYDSNTADNNWEFKAVGLSCPAKILYKEGANEATSVWQLVYQQERDSGSDCGSENTKLLSMPANWDARRYVVFAVDDSKGQIISVKPDSNVTFKKGGTYNGNTVYIQQNVEPYSCPLVIRKNKNWVLIPLEKKESEDAVSNQIRTLFDKELGVGDTDCGPTDNDDLKIFSQFGLPESYYDAGVEDDHYLKTDFGFDGENVAGADLDDIGILPVAQAAGIALNGPLKGGGYGGSSGGATGGATDDESNQTSCAIDGIGWIICPVMSFMGKLNDAAFGFLNNFLQVEPKLLTDKDTQAAWSNFRDIANIAFVIVFLIIIYSQITGAGISNYGIKRMLPKLFVAAILVNISYFICQIAVDVSNILGSSIYSMFKDMPTTDGETVGFGDGISWEVVAGYILATAGALLVGVLALTTISTAALLAFALVILILIARKAILVLLVVVAPLAFVAYLLPNTEQWFKRWWKMFTTLLMVFPVVAVIFGASTLAARIINNSAGGETVDGGDQYLLQLTALGIMAIPLFAVPAVLKGALSAAGSVGGKLAGWQDRANKGAMDKAKSGRFGEAKAAYNARRNKRRVERRLGEGTMASWGRSEKRADTRRGKFAAWAGSRGAAFDRSGIGQKLGGDRGAASAVAELQKMNAEEVERSISLLHGSGDAAGLIGRAQAQLVEANRRGDTIAARAATKVLSTQTGSRGIDSLHRTISEIESGEGGLHSSVSEDVKYEVTAAGLKGKNRSLDKWSRDEKTVIDPATNKPKAASLNDYDSDASTPGSLNEHEIAGHSVGQLERYGTSGAVDAALARRVLDAHSKGTLSLDGDKLKVFQEIDAGKKFFPPPAGSPKDTKGTWA